MVLGPKGFQKFLRPLQKLLLPMSPSYKTPLSSLSRNHQSKPDSVAKVKSSDKIRRFSTDKSPQPKKRKMDVRLLGFDSPLFSTLHHIMDVGDVSAATEKSGHAPTRAYVRDAKAMAATPADVVEYPNSYAFIIDMPGIKSEDIKVEIQDDNVLVISAERKREEEGGKEGMKYLRMERRVGKFMRKFALPENVNVEGITAVCKDGVLTVTVEKLSPPEPKKPKTIEVKIA